MDGGGGGGGIGGGVFNNGQAVDFGKAREEKRLNHDFLHCEP